jgi:hypothetical protein
MTIIDAFLLTVIATIVTLTAVTLVEAGLLLSKRFRSDQ